MPTQNMTMLSLMLEFDRLRGKIRLTDAEAKRKEELRKEIAHRNPRD